MIAIVGTALNVFTITIGFVKHRKYLVLALWSRSLGGADESFLQYLHSADTDNLNNVLVSCLEQPSLPAGLCGVRRAGRVAGVSWDVGACHCWQI